MGAPRVLVIEPYYGGSHRAFIDGLVDNVPGEYHLLALPARKWKWRMRGSAIHFASELAHSVAGVVCDADDATQPSQRSATGGPVADLIFCSSFLSLSDFKSIAPEPYRNLPSIAYFHENQFAYPLRAEHERDYHFGLTNVTTVLASDVACFNSRYNLDSFLEALPAFLAKMPDYRPVNLPEQIEAKARVISPPIDCAAIDRVLAHSPERMPIRPVHIVWNHRWEHDKNPDDFFEALYALDAEGIDFRVSVLGESFDESPPVFEEARGRLADRIENFGYLLHRDDYAKALVDADVVVSTADNEFFGMSVLEACYAGCYPVLPDRLAYRELFPRGFLYASRHGLIDRLRTLAADPPPHNAARHIAERHCWPAMATTYAELLAEVASRA